MILGGYNVDAKETIVSDLVCHCPLIHVIREAVVTRQFYLAAALLLREIDN